MTTEQTPAPALPFPYGPAPTPRPPAAVADMFRKIAADYTSKARDIVDADGYGERLVGELVDILGGMAAELDRYSETAIEPATALLTPCTPPDAADGNSDCHPGEAWPCSRTEAAWALRGWDADAQVTAAVRRARFRMAAEQDTAEEGR